MVNQIEIHQKQGDRTISVHKYTTTNPYGFGLSTMAKKEHANATDTQISYRTPKQSLKLTEDSSIYQGETVVARSYPLPGEEIECFVDQNKKPLFHAEIGLIENEYYIDLW